RSRQNRVATEKYEAKFVIAFKVRRIDQCVVIRVERLHPRLTPQSVYRSVVCDAHEPALGLERFALRWPLFERAHVGILDGILNQRQAFSAESTLQCRDHPAMTEPEAAFEQDANVVRAARQNEPPRRPRSDGLPCTRSARRGSGNRVPP